jgi:hypothetical protein
MQIKTKFRKEENKEEQSANLETQSNAAVNQHAVELINMMQVKLQHAKLGNIKQYWNQEIQRHASKFQSLENAALFSAFCKGE